MARKSVGTRTTVRDWILWGETEMDAAGVYFGHGTEYSVDEAAWLVGSALAIAPTALDAHLDDALTPAQQVTVRELIEQRIATRIPAAYLLNEAWFAGLKFFVDERVIVPRSLTGEFIVERFQPWIEPGRVRRLLDLCTGSGCMAIACAVAFPQAHVDAADISEDALAVARINIERHRMASRVRLLHSDLFSALAGARYDVIVTNPPYVGHEEMRALPAEYLREPRLALESGADGLEAITRTLAAAADHLEPQGVLVAEVGNSNRLLQQIYPEVPFLWLTTEAGDDSVFLLTAEQLFAHRNRFATGAR